MSLTSRVKGWFRRTYGFGAESLETVCGELVERARLGDQVAIGTLDQMRIQAAKSPPNPVAQKAFSVAWEYTKKNPIRVPSAIGVDAKTVLGRLKSTEDPQGVCGLLCALPTVGGEWALYAAALILANRGPLDIRAIAEGIAHDDVRAAFAGEATEPSDDVIDGSEPLAPYLHAARCVGEAGRLLALRSGSLPIAAYCVDMGFELGE